MKSGIVSVILLVVVLTSLQGQVNRFGVPLHSSYNLEPTGASEYNHCMTKDNNGVVYFGNDARGILRYDGANWTLIPVDGQPVLYSIASGTDNTIYAGGTYEFGYLSPGTNGAMSYTSLSHRLDSSINIGNVMSIMAFDDRVIFTATRNIFFYYPDNDSIVHFDGAARGFRNMWRMASLNGRVIVSDNVHGLFEIEGDTLNRIEGSEYYRRKVCRVMLPVDGNKIVIGTPSHGLSLFDIATGEVTENFVDPVVNEKLISGQIYTGTRVGNLGFAIGTLDLEGVLLFDYSGKLIYQFTNQDIGTDNNLVTAVYSSPTRLEELWICTIGTATKVYTGLPFTQFSEFQGIRSGVNAIVEFNNSVYISHDNGVSRLIEPVGGSCFFEKLLPDPVKPTYPMTLFKFGNDEFLIAGSQEGGFLIDRKNNVKNLGDITLDIEKSRSASIGGSQAIRSMDVRSVSQSKSDPRNLYLGVNSYLLVLRYEGNSGWRYLNEIKRVEGFVNMIFEDDRGRVWYSTNVSNSLYAISVVNGDSIFAEYNTSNGLPERSGIKVLQLDGHVVTTTPLGIYRLNEEKGRFEEYNDVFNDFTKDREVSLLKADADGDLWMSIRKETERFLETYLPNGKSASDYITLPFGVLPNAPSYAIESIRGREWMAKSKNVFVVDKDALIELNESIRPYLNGIVIGADSVYMTQSFTSTNEFGRRYPVQTHDGLKSVEFPYRLNDVSFYWTTNYYVDEDKTQYRFFLKGNDKEWSKWDNLLYKDFNNLRFGHYQFRLQARSATGVVSEESVFEFTILKPWYATFIAIIFYILAMAGIVLLIIKAYTKRLIRENLRLEGIVVERTAEVVKQKDELESSIHYASRIQMALLPSEKILSENIKNYFVLFKPRDIVSGDFYWMTKRNDKLFIVAADCTGHGVPGAFMSLLGMSFLDEIVNKSSIQRADLILRELRIHVTNSLKQVGEDDEAKDGMDMALLMVDFVAGKVEFSGAYNPCFKIRKLTDSETESFTEGKYDSEEGVMSNGRYLLETVLASKMPIGISARMKEDFILHQWDMEKGVSYYLFSDGYVDQFGSNGRKFMKKNFKKLLLDIQEYPMAKQKDILEETIRQWMGDTPQIDDILVMGLRTD